MGLLVGLPLKLFHILFVLLRLAWPLVLILLVVYFVQRRRGQTMKKPKQEPSKEPEFRGPVYTVDYTEVDDSEETK
jgi:inner membrane protein involved in colicin E2 resistance